MWVTNRGNSTLTELRASDGANLGTFSLGLTPEGLVYDGDNIGVANSTGNTVTRNPSN